MGQEVKMNLNSLILEHRNGKKEQKSILLVGKAVTFDTGGISLKPGEKMDEMKFDKMWRLYSIRSNESNFRIKTSNYVVAIIPSVENMPSGDAFRPGDIIKLFNVRLQKF